MSAVESLLIPTDDGQMPAHNWSPEHRAGRGPTIVLMQEIFGISDYIQQRASDLAGLGYTVIAPEIYWRLDDADVDESAPDFLQQALSVVGRLDWDRAVRDASAAVAYARERSDKVGLVGFCFGGGLAFNVAAVTKPDALVSYYGSALPDLIPLAPRVDAPSLHVFGETDDYIPMEVVDRIRAAVTQQPDVEFHTYPGAGHAFDNPRPVFHHPEASGQAWERTVSFLARTLPVA